MRWAKNGGKRHESSGRWSARRFKGAYVFHDRKITSSDQFIVGSYSQRTLKLKDRDPADTAYPPASCSHWMSMEQASLFWESTLVSA